MIKKFGHLLDSSIIFFLDLTKVPNPNISKYFPEKYVEQLVGASDKAFLHKRGKSVIKDENPGN